MTFVCSIIRVCGIIPGRGSLVPTHQPGAPFFSLSLKDPVFPRGTLVARHPRHFMQSKGIGGEPFC